MKITNKIFHVITKKVKNDIIRLEINLDDLYDSNMNVFYFSLYVNNIENNVTKYVTHRNKQYNEIIKYFPELKSILKMIECDSFGIPQYAIFDIKDINDSNEIPLGHFFDYYDINDNQCDIKQLKEKYIKDRLRLTKKEVKVLLNCKNVDEIHKNLHELNIVKRWNSEAKKAIKKLENLAKIKYSENSTYNNIISDMLSIVDNN